MVKLNKGLRNSKWRVVVDDRDRPKQYVKEGHQMDLSFSYDDADIVMVKSPTLETFDNGKKEVKKA